jgi:hypothetical protein
MWVEFGIQNHAWYQFNRHWRALSAISTTKDACLGELLDFGPKGKMKSWGQGVLRVGAGDFR